MHIPDGFLDAKTAAASAVLAAVGLSVALRSIRRNVPQSRVPLLGLTGAFVFAAQMLNFPVAGGTSGHLLGAVLAAVLLGPSCAVLVLSAVLILQCFMFADGGVTALGANIFNMAVVAPVVGYGVYSVVRRLGGRGLRTQLLATGFAAWCSTVAAAATCAAELAFSGTVAWAVALPAMAGVHMLVGIGEGVITTLVIAAVAKARPQLLLRDRLGAKEDYRAVIVYGLLVTIGLALFVSPVASSRPDALDRVAARLGFSARAKTTPMVGSPIAHYALPGLGSSGLATAVAGCLGTVVAFALAYALARLLTPARSRHSESKREEGRCDAPRAT